MKLMYRYEARPNPSFDFNEEDTILTPDVFCVVSTTKCGVWINAWGIQKFINLTWRKKWANETIEEAKEGFLKRKRKQVEILKAQLALAEKHLLLAEQGKFKEEQSS